MTTTTTAKSSRSKGGKPRANRKSLGFEVIKWIETHCVLTAARWYGQPFRLLPWQKKLLVELFEVDDDRRRHRWAYISVPKKNGKTELMAALALWFLIASGEPSPLVACAAGSDDQADLIFGAAKTMCEESGTLRLICETFDGEIQVPSIPGAKLVRVAASARRFGSNLDGKNIYVVICDELHVWEGERGELVWGTLTRGTLARREPMVLQVTTAGYDRDSICYRQYEHAKNVLADPEYDREFYAYIIEADEGADHTDPTVWQAVNPSYGEIMDESAYRSQLAQQHEYEFRRFYLNQWTSNLAAWLPAGAWEACVDRERSIPDRARVVLAFDGSYNNDSTALVACSIDRKPHIEVVAVWERPAHTAEEWTVPILDVEDAIRTAWQRWRVKEIVCDAYRWARSFEILESEGLPVVKFPQNAERMTPATSKFYDAVVNGTLTHSGDAALGRHIANALLKTDSRGSRLTKDSKHSTRRIDLAVAAVMALDRASHYAQHARSRVVNMAEVLARLDTGSDPYAIPPN